MPPPENASGSLLWRIGCGLLLLGGVALVVLLCLLLALPLPRTDLLSAGGASLVVLAVGAALLARSVFMERGTMVTVDDWQLYWRRFP